MFRRTFKISANRITVGCMQTGLSRSRHVVSTLSSHETKYAYRSGKREKLLKRDTRERICCYQITQYLESDRVTAK